MLLVNAARYACTLTFPGSLCDARAIIFTPAPSSLSLPSIATVDAITPPPSFLRFFRFLPFETLASLCSHYLEIFILPSFPNPLHKEVEESSRDRWLTKRFEVCADRRVYTPRIVYVCGWCWRRDLMDKNLEDFLAVVGLLTERKCTDPLLRKTGGGFFMRMFHGICVPAFHHENKLE